MSPADTARARELLVHLRDVARAALPPAVDLVTGPGADPDVSVPVLRAVRTLDLGITEALDLLGATARDGGA